MVPTIDKNRGAGIPPNVSDDAPDLLLAHGPTVIAVILTIVIVSAGNWNVYWCTAASSFWLVSVGGLKRRQERRPKVRLEARRLVVENLFELLCITTSVLWIYTTISLYFEAFVPDTRTIGQLQAMEARIRRYSELMEKAQLSPGWS